MDYLGKELMVLQAGDERPWRTAAPRFFGEGSRRSGRRGGREGQALPKRAAETPADAPRFVGE
jgi:hypothetical protein